MKTTAIILFILTYVLLLSLPKIRAYIALTSAAIFVFLGILPLDKVIAAIDWNVILMIAGTMGVVGFFIESKMPSLLADKIINWVPNVKWAIVALALFAGVISAFVDNVATVLMVAPVAVNISKKLKMSPVLSVISIAISSNLQGAATLVGDTTSILLGGHANLSFIDFFYLEGKPGIFWAVEAGALASVIVLLVLFRKEKQLIETQGLTEVKDYFPTVLLAGIIVLLILNSFVPNDYKPDAIEDLMNGIICMSLFLIGLIRKIIKTRKADSISEAVNSIDYDTILLLTGLFVVIGGITEAGLVKDISQIFVKASGDNVFLMYTLIVWASVLFSAFIDNIPYVATMLPVVGEIAKIMGVQPNLLYFGLLTGATLAAILHQ